jgi:hypothetical protein
MSITKYTLLPDGTYKVTAEETMPTDEIAEFVSRLTFDPVTREFVEKSDSLSTGTTDERFQSRDTGTGKDDLKDGNGEIAGN